MHNRLLIPDGDMLIHAGDFTGNGSLEHLIHFADWLKELPHKHKIVIAGNHDAIAESNTELTHHILAKAGVIYLQDESININGLNFYGSPWSPAFYDWHFMADRGIDMAKKWSKIPDDTDVLITHSPCYSILDNVHGKSVGCEELSKVVSKIRPKAHICGHIHEGYGVFESCCGSDKKTIFINASTCNGDYVPINKPIEIELNE